jgi:hypothetical protein
MYRMVLCDLRDAADRDPSSRCDGLEREGVTMTTIEVNSRDLHDTIKTALTFAHDDSTRTYHGVLIERSGEIVATNGHMLIVIESGWSFSRSVLLPRGQAMDAVRLMSPLARKNTERLVGFTGDTLDGRVLTCGNSADFPQWRNVMPEACERPLGRVYVDPAYLAVTGKVFAPGKAMRIECGEDALSPIVLSGRTARYFAAKVVIMPMRCKP